MIAWTGDSCGDECVYSFLVILVPIEYYSVSTCLHPRCLIGSSGCVQYHPIGISYKDIHCTFEDGQRCLHA